MKSIVVLFVLALASASARSPLRNVNEAVPVAATGSGEVKRRLDCYYDEYGYYICVPDPTPAPTPLPTKKPTLAPTKFPTTKAPTKFPTKTPTKFPTKTPTKFPTKTPTKFPTKNPTKFPTKSPTKFPTTAAPTQSPTIFPTVSPTENPTTGPTVSPTAGPTTSPTESPTGAPSTLTPTASPVLKSESLGGKGLAGGMMVIIIAVIAALVLILLAMLLTVMAYRRKPKKNEDLEKDFIMNFDDEHLSKQIAKADATGAVFGSTLERASMPPPNPAFDVAAAPIASAPLMNNIPVAPVVGEDTRGKSRFSFRPVSKADNAAERPMSLSFFVRKTPKPNKVFFDPPAEPSISSSRSLTTSGSMSSPESLAPPVPVVLPVSDSSKKRRKKHRKTAKQVDDAASTTPTELASGSNLLSVDGEAGKPKKGYLQKVRDSASDRISIFRPSKDYIASMSESGVSETESDAEKTMSESGKTRKKTKKKVRRRKDQSTLDTLDQAKASGSFVEIKDDDL